jgi:hypothetical protein
MMELFDFEVLRGDETIAATRSVPLPDQSAAWPRIATLAKTVAEPGCRIRVTNQAREMVILIGVAAALYTATLISSRGPNARLEVSGPSTSATNPHDFFAARIR